MACIAAVTVLALRVDTSYAAPSAFNSVRIAMVPPPHQRFVPGSGFVVPDNFLERAVEAGYNYIVWDMSLTADIAPEWRNGRYRYFSEPQAPRTYLDGVRDAFVRIHEFGRRRGVRLHLIPFIQSGSCHADHLRHTNNPALDWAPVIRTQLDKRVMNMAREENAVVEIAIEPQVEYERVFDAFWHCPAFAPDSLGYDRTFRGIMEVFAQAFVEAGERAPGVPGELEFFHIGHDEPVTMDLNPVEASNQFLPGCAAIDKKWVYNNVPDHGGIRHQEPLPCPSCPPHASYVGEVNALGKQYLLADELTRRVRDVHTARSQDGVEPFANTSIMLHTDVWDPQNLGDFYGTTGAIDLLAPDIRDALVFMTNQYNYTHINPTLFRVWNVDVTFVDAQARHATGTVELTADSRGHRYDAAAAFAHFSSKGVRFTYKWSHSYVGYERFRQAFRLTDVARTHREHCIGYCAAFYTSFMWDSSHATYDQAFPYNTLEILGNEAGGFGQRSSAALTLTNSTFFGRINLMPSFTIGDTAEAPALLLDRRPVSRLDYFLVNRTVFEPDNDAIDEHKHTASWHDALWFCNNLSKREGLDTVYTFDSVTTADRVLQRRVLVLRYASLRAEANRNGYRLPTVEELRYARANGFTEPHGQREWAWVGSAHDPTVSPKDGRGYLYDGEGEAVEIDGAGVRHNVVFRICRDASAGASSGTVVTGGSEHQPDAAIAADSVTISDFVVGPLGAEQFAAGRKVRVHPETVFHHGAEVSVQIERYLSRSKRTASECATIPLKKARQ